jgi:hypothetical protein
MGFLMAAPEPTSPGRRLSVFSQDKRDAFLKTDAGPDDVLQKNQCLGVKVV